MLSIEKTMVIEICINKLWVFLLYCSIIVNALFLPVLLQHFHLNMLHILLWIIWILLPEIFYTAQQEIHSKLSEALCLDFTHEEQVKIRPTYKQYLFRKIFGSLKTVTTNLMRTNSARAGQKCKFSKATPQSKFSLTLPGSSNSNWHHKQWASLKA